MNLRARNNNDGSQRQENKWTCHEKKTGNLPPCLWVGFFGSILPLIYSCLFVQNSGTWSNKQSFSNSWKVALFSILRLLMKQFLKWPRWSHNAAVCTTSLVNQSLINPLPYSIYCSIVNVGVVYYQCQDMPNCSRNALKLLGILRPFDGSVQNWNESLWNCSEISLCK